MNKKNLLFATKGQSSFPVFKGSWKREKWGVGKESNVTIWCRTVAIDVYLQFEHAVLE
jgi:hypothetical protein